MEDYCFFSLNLFLNVDEVFGIAKLDHIIVHTGCIVCVLEDAHFYV